MSHLPVFIGDVSAVLSTRGIHACVVDTLALILHNVPRALGPVKFAVHERDLDRATAALTSKHTGILYKAVPHPSWDWMHSYTAYTRHFQVTTAPPGTLYGSAHEEVTLVSAEWLEIRLDQESTLLHSDQIQGVLYPTLSSLLCSLLSMFHREEDLRGHCMMDIDYLVHHNPQLDDSWLAAHIPPDVPGREIIARQANKRERRKRTDIKAQRDDSPLQPGILRHITWSMAFGGDIVLYRLLSEVLYSTVQIAVFLPKETLDGEKVPVIYFLASRGWQEDDAPRKAGMLHSASRHGTAVVFLHPFTISDPENTTDTVQNNFYLNCSHRKWAEHGKYADFITKELPKSLRRGGLPFTEDMSIMGHLTGGTAALNLYLRNPGLYRSASALAPILDVTQDRAALSELVGEDAQEYLLEGGILEARMWNPIDLIKELDVEDVHITMNMAPGKRGSIMINANAQDFMEVVPGRYSPDNVSMEVPWEPYEMNDSHFVASFAPTQVDFHAKYLKVALLT